MSQLLQEVNSLQFLTLKNTLVKISQCAGKIFLAMRRKLGHKPAHQSRLDKPILLAQGHFPQDDEEREESSHSKGFRGERSLIEMSRWQKHRGKFVLGSS